MPCSRCHLAGHNARNRMCPALFVAPVAEVHSVPVNPVNPTFAEIRPRGYVSSRRRPTHALLEFIRRFQNTPPQFITLSIRGDTIYHCYQLPRNLMESPVINRAILHHFIHPITRTVQLCPVSITHIAGLAIRLPNGHVRILWNEPYPVNEVIYLIVPQLPGITIEEAESDDDNYWISAHPRLHQRSQAENSGELRSSGFPGTPTTSPPGSPGRSPRRSPGTPTTSPPEYYTVPVVPETRLTLSYIRDWKITVNTSVNSTDTPNDVCMICLDEKPATRFAQTNCKHEYCVDCLILHANSNKHNAGEMRCPMCRTNLSGIVLSNNEAYTDLRQFLQNV